MEPAFDALWVLLGAGIAALTTWLFNRSLEYDRRKSLAFSLFVKSFRIVDDIMRMDRDLKNVLDTFEKHEGAPAKRDELWGAIPPFLGTPSDSIEFTGEELAIFENDGASIGQLLEFVTTRRLLFETIDAYSTRRTRLGEELAEFSTFPPSASGLKAETAFDARERPDLYKDIRETNKLAIDMIESTERGKVAAQKICDLINAELPKRFKKRDFKLRMSFPHTDHSSTS